MAQASFISVKQVRSGAGRNQRVRHTLKALGLSKVGDVRKLPKNNSVLGMVDKIKYLVEVTE